MGFGISVMGCRLLLESCEAPDRHCMGKNAEVVQSLNALRGSSCAKCHTFAKAKPSSLHVPKAGRTLLSPSQRICDKLGWKCQRCLWSSGGQDADLEWGEKIWGRVKTLQLQRGVVVVEIGVLLHRVAPHVVPGALQVQHP